MAERAAATRTTVACTITKALSLHDKGPNDLEAAGSSVGQERLRASPVSLGLWHRRSCLVPTLQGWVALMLCFGALLFVLIRCAYPFLALNAPVSGGILVVEGWTPDFGLRSAMAECQREHYQKIYVTGGPLEVGMPLAAYKTYAQLGAATLIMFGLDSNVVQAVPAPQVRQDRTYSSAVSLKQWLLEHGIQPTRIHLITEGPHARRSRLLYEKAMGPGVEIGVTAIPPRQYDPRRWWRSSAGFRNVTDEAIAYFYARLIFSPPRE